MAFGRAMGEISVEFMHPAVKAFPEMEPDATCDRGGQDEGSGQLAKVKQQDVM